MTMNSSNFPTELLHQGAHALGMELTQQQTERFVSYAALLCEWNERMNLTAITDPEGIAVRHFIDSLTLLGALTPPPCG